MTARSIAWLTALVAIAVVLAAATPAAAHGVDVSADLGDAIVHLELTDETGRVCARVDGEAASAASFEVADLASGATILDLGESLGPDEECQFLDADTVDDVLADVDGHELVRTSPDGSVDRAPLRKPLPPESETALPASSASTEAEDDDTAEAADDGPNVALVFAIGAAAGLVLTVVRKRLASK